MNRETWLDWLAPDAVVFTEQSALPLLTREELIGKLLQGGANVSLRNLDYWTAQGVIPRPTKRRDPQKGYARFPSWMTDIIQRLLKEQSAGIGLVEIGWNLRAMVAETAVKDIAMSEAEFRRKTLHDVRQRLDAIDHIVKELTVLTRSLDGGE